MSVRKRTWTTRSGEAKEAWIADYVDADGDRHIKTFDRKKDAEAWSQQVGVDVRAGTHTPAAKSITVAQAAADWLAYVRGEKRERATLAQYTSHARHINERIGKVKLAKLTTPSVNALRDDLLASLSRPLARKVLTSLKSILKEAQRRGNVAQNVALPVRIAVDRRGEGKLQYGVDIPTRQEIKQIIDAATGYGGRHRPLLMMAIFTGLRASELRGLRWQDVDLARGELHVRQRADLYNTIGSPKSRAGARTVPLPPVVVNALRQWKIACPRSDLDLVFPTRSGQVLRHSHVQRQTFTRVLRAAGVVDAQGKPKYGVHSLRHFYASWCINRKADGGLELPPKLVQARLGHASVSITFDVYGHLFPRGDDGSELDEASRLLLA
jgi:integrase